MTTTRTTVVRCRACGDSSTEVLTEAGEHPVANRYLRAATDPEDRFPLTLRQCRDCGLIQLEQAVPVEALVPRFDWITYNEPEGHLDAVVETLRALPGVEAHSTIGAITYKDDSTVARLGRLGFSSAWRVDPVGDLGATPAVGLETIQDRVTAAPTLADRYPPAKILLVRHILEHGYDLPRFAAALRRLVAPGGYLVFEVPDCTQLLETLDYTMLWEEHLVYFTPATYLGTLERLGFEVVRFDSYPYPFENSLIAIVRARPAGAPVPRVESLTQELARGRRFAEGFASRKAAIQKFFTARRAAGRRTAIFGAGHLSCMFINLMDVAADIAFVVDDHPGKRGLLMPGSRVPIRGSEHLLSQGIDLCLSSLSPESETKVMAKQSTYLERGGQLTSLFPSSRRAHDFAAGPEAGS